MRRLSPKWKWKWERGCGSGGWAAERVIWNRKNRIWQMGGALWGTRVMEIVKKHDSGGLLWKRIKLTTTRKANAKKRLLRVWQVSASLSIFPFLIFRTLGFLFFFLFFFSTITLFSSSDKNEAVLKACSQSSPSDPATAKNPWRTFSASYSFSTFTDCFVIYSMVRFSLLNVAMPCFPYGYYFYMLVYCYYYYYYYFGLYLHCNIFCFSLWLLGFFLNSFHQTGLYITYNLLVTSVCERWIELH